MGITANQLRAWHAHEASQQRIDCGRESPPDRIRDLPDDVIEYLSSMICMAEYREEHARRKRL